MLADDANDVCEVWPENRQALEVFLALQTQWRTGALGGVLGLDYTALEAVLRMMQVTDQPTMFEDMQIMERAALEELSKKYG